MAKVRVQQTCVIRARKVDAVGPISRPRHVHHHARRQPTAVRSLVDREVVSPRVSSSSLAEAGAAAHLTDTTL